MLEEWNVNLNCSLNGSMLMSGCTLYSIFYKKNCTGLGNVQKKNKMPIAEAKKHIVVLKLGK